MFDAVAAAIAFFYDLWPSYAGAIVLLTLAIMVVLTPLSIKGTRSMIAMSRLQPEMKKLQQKHKGDRERLNQEMLAFYQEHKINPLAGCLPLLLQMPIFIVLYRVIDGLGRVETRSVAGGEIEGPKYLDEGTRLFQDLSDTIEGGAEGAIEMVSFGVDLTRTLTGAFEQSFVEALPFLVLVGLVAGTGYIQQKQISARQQGAPVNPQQQMMTRLMPGFFALISIGIPAGVVLYFVVSNLVRIGQQAVITRMEVTPTKAGAAGDKGGEKDRRRGGGDRGGGGRGGGGRGGGDRAIDARSEEKRQSGDGRAAGERPQPRPRKSKRKKRKK